MDLSSSEDFQKSFGDVIRASQQRQKQILQKIASKASQGSRGHPGQAPTAGEEAAAAGTDRLKLELSEKTVEIAALQQQLLTVSTQQANSSYQAAQWNLLEQQMRLQHEDLQHQAASRAEQLNNRIATEADLRQEIADLHNSKLIKDRENAVAIGELEAQLGLVCAEVERREVLRKQQSFTLDSLDQELRACKEREAVLGGTIEGLQRALQAAGDSSEQKDARVNELTLAGEEGARALAQLEARRAEQVRRLQNEVSDLKVESAQASQLREEVEVTRQLGQMQASHLQASQAVVSEENHGLRQLVSDLQTGLDAATARLLDLTGPESELAQTKRQHSQCAEELGATKRLVHKHEQTLVAQKEQISALETQLGTTTGELLMGFSGLQRVILSTLKDHDEDSDSPQSPPRPHAEATVEGSWVELCRAAGEMMQAMRVRNARVKDLELASQEFEDRSKKQKCFMEDRAKELSMVGAEMSAAADREKSLQGQLVVTRARAQALAAQLLQDQEKLSTASQAARDTDQARQRSVALEAEVEALKHSLTSAELQLVKQRQAHEEAEHALERALGRKETAWTTEREATSQELRACQGRLQDATHHAEEQGRTLARLSAAVPQMACACRLLFRGASSLHARFIEVVRQKNYLAVQARSADGQQEQIRHLLHALSGQPPTPTRVRRGKAGFRVAVLATLAARRMARHEGVLGTPMMVGTQQIFIARGDGVLHGTRLPVCDDSTAESSSLSLSRLLTHLSPTGAFGHSLSNMTTKRRYLNASGDDPAIAMIRRVSLSLAVRVGDLEGQERDLRRQCQQAKADVARHQQRSEQLSATNQTVQATADRLDQRVHALVDESMCMVEPEQLQRVCKEKIELENRLATAQQGYEALRHEAQTLQTHLASAEAQAASSTQQAELQAQELASLQEYGGRKSTECQALQSKLSDTAQRMEAAQLNMDMSTVTNKTTIAKLNAAEKDLGESRLLIRRLQEANLALEMNSHSRESDRLALEAQLQEKEAQLQEKDNDLLKIQQMLSGLHHSEN